VVPSRPVLSGVADSDRLGDLGENDSIGSWLVSVLPSAGGRALDLGCGAGRHAVLLAGRFAHVVAIDLSRPVIEIARARRSRPNVAYQQADLPCPSMRTTGATLLATERCSAGRARMAAQSRSARVAVSDGALSV
jgi:SAM-dependent methyltransferase